MRYKLLRQTFALPRALSISKQISATQAMNTKKP